MFQPDVKKNEKDYLNGGLTPLMVAVKHKNVEAVRKMVKFKDVDLDPLDSEGHSLEFLVRRVESSRNAELLYILEASRQQRQEEEAAEAGGWMTWLGFRWGGETGKKEIDEEERQRRAELREKEVFELQRLKEQDEMRKRKVIEKSVNSCLDLLERKKEELENKELVLRELKLIHANERKQLEEEFVAKQKLLEERQLEEATKVDLEKEKLENELNSLEEQLEELMTSGQTTEEVRERFLPCPECPVCLEMLMPPIRIMQCSNGHLVCEVCQVQPELSCCPTCREEFTGRATAMEQHLASLFS